MYSGSPRNLWMAWPPGATLLNFPQPPGPQIQRTVSVHFRYPQDSRRPRQLGVQPANEGAAGQPEDPGTVRRSLVLNFIKLCYLVSSIYSLIAALQMVIMATILPPEANLMFPGFVCVMVSLATLFMLSVLSRLRRILWLSFTLSILFAELVCMGATMFLIRRSLLNVFVALVAAYCFLIICYMAGAWLPRIILPGERIMLVLIVIFAVTSVSLITTHIYTNELLYASVYFVVLLIMLIPTSAYHAQIIHGRRFRMPVYDYVLCATYVYLHFLLFFSASYFCFWVSEW